MAFSVDSEVGKLRKVIVHRPGPRAPPADAGERRGAALRRRDLGPQGEGRARRLRAGDARARGRGLRRRGPARRDARDRRGQGLDRSTSVLNERQVGQYLARSGREWADVGERRREVADFLIGGITKDDVDEGAGLVWQSADPIDMLLPPLPNFLFQRDPSSLDLRRRDAQPDDEAGAPAGDDDHGGDLPLPPDVRRRRRRQRLARRRRRGLGPVHVEGGDVQPIGNGAVMIGMGERTTPAGGRDPRPRRCSRAGAARARARRAAAAVALLHAPRHGDHDGRPRRGHAVPAGRQRRRPDLGDATRRPSRRRCRSSSSFDGTSVAALEQALERRRASG